MSLNKLALGHFKKIGIWNKVFPTYKQLKHLYMGFYDTRIWLIIRINSTESVKHWICLRAPRIINVIAPISAKCLNTQSILKSKFCDGINHYQGDEDNCPSMCGHTNKDILCEYSYWQYQCKDVNECVAWSNVCDGNADCSDQSDEFQCTNELPSKHALVLFKRSNNEHKCPENWSSCGNVTLFCYPSNKMCLYERNLVGEQKNMVQIAIISRHVLLLSPILISSATIHFVSPILMRVME